MGLGLQIASGGIFSNTSLLSAMYYYNIFWRWKEDNDHDADWYIIFSVFQYFPVFFQYFCKDEMKMLIDTVEGEDTLSSQMIASTSGKYDRAQGR